MSHNFDEIIERRGTDSIKWSQFAPDIIPMWVADMDFRSPEPVIRALHERIDHGVFGYGDAGKELKDVICERLLNRYQWKVEPEEIVFLPNLVNGLFVAGKGIGEPTDRILVQTPVYGPFLMSADQAKRPMDVAELTKVTDGRKIRYEIDFDAFEAAITPQTSLFLLCSPHNPVGRVWERWELEKMAEICLRHNIVICSDEIHSDLIYSGYKHIPTATISPEVADNTITLLAASKTFNLPGLSLGFAIVKNPELRKRVTDTYSSMGVHISSLGFVATIAAYREGQPWLDDLLKYLEGNRDYLENYVAQNFPRILTTHQEGTYLGWLDCCAADIPGLPHEFFTQEARVAVTGGWFGQGCQGFVRMNYGCPRPVLVEALDRMHEALSRLG